MGGERGDLDGVRPDLAGTLYEVDEPEYSVGVRRAVPAAQELAAAGFVDGVEVGRGGFGVVYRCRQVRLGRIVAVKVLTLELGDGGARFVREQQAMGRLTGHPNIVSLLQVGEIACGQPFLVMPFCGQGSLGDRIARLNMLGVDEVLRTGVKVAGALASAHRLGIVHRDVKPANILMTDYGEPALCDFGIARMAGSAVNTASGLFIGSPAFTAPEVIGGALADSASDVYGLGATLFCGLTGRAPFEGRDGEHLMAQLARIAQQGLPDLRDYRISDDVASVVEKAMSPNPDDRPTAERLGELLQRAQAQHGLSVDAMALHGHPSSLPGSLPPAVPTTAGPGLHSGAEYKQVTVLFADVMDSIDLAAAVGVERLHEIMTQLLDGALATVRRYGGTVDRFTGDGIMAVFGAPASLEDHAVRACVAALQIRDDVVRLAGEVRDRDGVELPLQIGLNSGEVIVGEIGSGGLGYSTVGTAIGMARQMESAAPPGGVMLSASTARLVKHIAVLGEPEPLNIRGAADPILARRLLAMATPPEPAPPPRSTLVGREVELQAISAMLDRAVGGRGCVVRIVGPPGIGKTRLVAETVRLAKHAGAEVFSTYCESHTSDIPFQVVAGLLRAVAQISSLDDAAARARVRTLVPPDADAEDLLLLDDLLGIADPDTALPKIDPDARRRRLTALINAAQLARAKPAVFIVEDAHWIDKVSDSMLADFAPMIGATPSLMLTTYRPEYRGALAGLSGAQTLALAPLTDAETTLLVDELLGPDPSVRAVGDVVAARASGNPFFAEEIVRDLADRGGLVGERGAYVCCMEARHIGVPATLQASIAARIDRLPPAAKRTLAAGAVIGSRFSCDLLASLDVDASADEFDALVGAELIDQVRFTAGAEYAFRHPLIRTVAYEAQLTADRARLHRRLAGLIEAGEPESVEANAALIAEHLEAAGDWHAAFGWHMRAATWATNRDITAAQLSWERARATADALPADDPARPAMRIAPRTMLCGIAWRVREHVTGARFDELRQLCAAAGDDASLAIGMSGLAVDHIYQGRVREGSRLASEAWALAESIGDPTLTVGLSVLLLYAKIENGGWPDILRWSQTVIDLADGDPTKGDLLFGSPLAVAHATRGGARYWLGRPRWREDLQHALTMARGADPLSFATVVTYVYSSGIPFGVLTLDDSARSEIADALSIAERSGDDLAVNNARLTVGVALVHSDTAAERDRGHQLLTQVREVFPRGGHSLADLPLVEVYLAWETARRGDADDALPVMRDAVGRLVAEGQLLAWGIAATGVLVRTLLDRGTDDDLAEAEVAIERLAAEPTGDGSALRDVWLSGLRARLARVRGDVAGYREHRDSYRHMATTLGFEGHIGWAEAMSAGG